MNLKIRLAIVAGLVLVAGVWSGVSIAPVVPLPQPLSDFPMAVRGWLMVSNETLSPEILAVLKPTDYLSRDYARYDGTSVHLYISYYGGGPAGGEIHSPRHCLAGSGWHADSRQELTREIAGGKINLVRAVSRKGRSRELIYYWYQVHGRTINDEFSLKLAEITSSLLDRRRDAAIIKISIPLQDDQEAAVVLAERFLEDFYPTIQQAFPK